MTTKPRIPRFQLTGFRSEERAKMAELIMSLGGTFYESEVRNVERIGL